MAKAAQSSLGRVPVAGARSAVRPQARDTADDALATYRSKRDFAITPEPARGGARGGKVLQFVVQKHWASRLHYDFRLELSGSMKSWAVPKGPSLDPQDRRMAVQVEDHPIAYNRFEGEIPEGQYGAGKVIVWDKGTWVPEGDAAHGYRAGKLKFQLHGHKLQGGWTLVRMHGRGDEKQPPWLLIKERDEAARSASDYDLLAQRPESVKSLDSPAVARAARAEAAPAAPRKRPATANASPLPATLAPQLATLVDKAPADSAGWIFEPKLDGYRLLARVDGKDVRLFTRNGNDWTGKLPQVAAAVGRLKLRSGWLDGEILVPGPQGAPDFQALQNAFDLHRPQEIVYVLFDLPFLDGQDLRPLPLTERRDKLRSLMARSSSERLRISESIEVRRQDLVATACRLGYEGVIGKRADAAYVSRRSPDWIKLKCSHRQEFVIGGYTEPQGSRSGLGALLLGVHDDKGVLRYAGKVGTGFSEHTLATLRRQLDELHADENPFGSPVAGAARARWVQPRLLAEVSFVQWTDSGHVRHAVFHGLRSDKAPRAITRERAQHLSAGPTKAAARASARQEAAMPADLPGQLRVTHPERVVDPASGTTKMALVRYYASVAALMFDHLRDRPVSLVRAPSGIGGQVFFQKHEEGADIPGVEALDASLDPEHAPLLQVRDAAGLVQAIQMNVVEFHSWNARKDNILRPDRMTFDLDPGEGVAWPQIQEGAELVRVLLEELGLPGFLKTSGGKGLHVVVPLKRLHDWDTVKGFSAAVVAHLAATVPQRFVARSGPRNRVGRIFVDYLRNGWGATTAAAWSARARPGMGVSVPVAWTELGALRSGAHWTVQNIDARLATGNTPWKGYAKSARSLRAAMQVLTPKAS